MTIPPTSAADPPKKSWLERKSVVIGSIAALIAIFAAMFGLAKWVFSPPRVMITVEQTKLSLPTSLTDDLDRAVSRSPLPPQADSLRLALSGLREYIRQTRNYTIIEITNNSDESVTNVDVRVKDAWNVTGWSVGGDFLTAEERASIVSRIRYDRENSLLTIPVVPRMPRKTSMRIHIWGDIPFERFFDASESVAVSFDGGTGEFRRTSKVTGLDAFVYENGGLLILVLAALNLAVYAPLLGRRGTSSEEQPAAS